MKKALYILIVIIFILYIDKINAYTEYKVGDLVTYNGVNYRVLKDVKSTDTKATLLKAEPLSVAEVNQYGAGHVNRYTSSSVGTAYDSNGYGGMAYYTSETCGYVNNTWVDTGCKNDYASSEIKYVVEAWKAAKASAASEARLITIEDLMNNLGYEEQQYCSAGECSMQKSKTENTPSWIYNSNYWYWTSTQYNDSSSIVWHLHNDGGLGSSSISSLGDSIVGSGVVRPVITLKKTVLGDKDESVIVDKDNETVDNKTDTKDNIDDNKTNQTKTTVKVDNTYMSSSILLIILGFITASISVLIIYKLSNKKK